MGTTKLYFRTEDDEKCYMLSQHLDDAKDEGLTEIELFEAIPDKSKEYFYCREYQEVTLVEEDTCGRFCDGYALKNGKSGMCRHKTHCHTWGEKKTFKI